MPEFTISMNVDGVERSIVEQVPKGCIVNDILIEANDLAKASSLSRVVSRTLQQMFFDIAQEVLPNAETVDALAADTLVEQAAQILSEDTTLTQFEQAGS